MKVALLTAITSGMFGYILDAKFGIREPSLYWFIGLITGMVVAYMLINEY